MCEKKENAPILLNVYNKWILMNRYFPGKIESHGAFLTHFVHAKTLAMDLMSK